MSKKDIKFNNFLTNSVQLIMEEEDFGDAFASISLNPTLTWVKFVLTDDQPNGNKQRIPKEEFANLIKTGINMPIKMAFGEIKSGHQDAFALGTITHLKEVGNQVHGLAGLWNRERPEDVDFIKSKFVEAAENGNVPQLSWEIMYTESAWGYEGDDGIENLQNTALRAVTFVGLPAYEGRTPILAVATKYKEAKEDLEKAKLEATEEELKMIEEIEGELEMDELKEKLQEANDKLAEATDKIRELEEELAELKPQLEELSELREYKDNVEAEKAEATKFDSIKQKFEDAELEKDDEYFAEKRELLLAMDEDTLDFMIQELIAFSAETNTDDDDDDDDPEVPAITSKSSKKLNFKQLAEELRKDL